MWGRAWPGWVVDALAQECLVAHGSSKDVVACMRVNLDPSLGMDASVDVALRVGYALTRGTVRPRFLSCVCAGDVMIPTGLTGFVAFHLVGIAPGYTNSLVQNDPMVTCQNPLRKWAMDLGEKLYRTWSTN